MGQHTFDASEADRLERAEHRFRYCSAEELLWAVDPAPDDALVDLGSGTGFFTDVVAPHAGTVHAVDVQPAMHDHYREKGVPATVSLATAEVATLPFDADALDGAFSTMTYHEFATETALAEVRRVLVPGGRIAIVDWAASGSGEAGPPVTERYAVEEAAGLLETAGFAVDHAAGRPETFLLRAHLP